VPRLDRDPRARRELGEALAEELGVGFERGWQLQQDRVELVLEPGRPLHQPPDRLLRLAQPLDVGEEPAGLDRPAEVRRCALPPLPERLELRQPVEGVVALDRGEELDVVLEPEPLRQLGRVEASAPVAVLPARGPDDHGHA